MATTLFGNNIAMSEECQMALNKDVESHPITLISDNITALVMPVRRA